MWKDSNYRQLHMYVYMYELYFHFSSISSESKVKQWPLEQGKSQFLFKRTW